MAACQPPGDWRRARSTSSSSIGTTTTCSSRCSTRSRPRACRRPTSHLRFAAFFADSANASVILAKVSGVDVAAKELVAEGRRIPFDYLIVATGAEHAYFGNDWSSYAPGLKTIDDATYLRRRILLAFERAETEPDRGRAEPASEFRCGRRRPDRRGDGRRHRGIGEAGAGVRFPLHRSALRAGRPDRGRATAAGAVRSCAVGGRTSLAGAAGRGRPARGRRLGLRLLRGFDRRGTHRDAHDRLGCRRQGIAGRRVARRCERPRGPGEGAGRSVSSGASEYLRDRRRRLCPRGRRQAVAGRGARCEASKGTMSDAC